MASVKTKIKLFQLQDVADRSKNSIVDGPFGSNLKTTDYVQSGVPVLQGKNITNNKFRWFDVRYITDQKAGELIRSKAEVGDILLVKIGSIGYVAEIDNLNGHPFAIIPANLAKIKLDSSKINSKYFCYFFQFQKTKEKLFSLASKTAQPALSLTKIKEFTIPVPDLPTQQKIAQILSEAEKVRQLRKQANALTEQFLQSTFLSMFGDPVSNPKGWKTETVLESGSKVQIGPFGTQLHVEDYVEGGIPLINPTHIQNSKIKEDNNFTITPEKFDELSNYHLLQGDIIMGRRGEMGRCALVTKREQGWLCGTGSLFIRPSKKLDSLYLLNVLTSKSFKETLEHEAKGVTMANLNKTIINNLLIPIPPKKLQQQFADIIADTEQLRQRQRAHEQELDQLFKGLLQKYFG